MSTLVAILILFSGLAWTIVYIESIRIGFAQRTYAMPFVALGLNFAWEWLYAITGIAGGGDVQSWVNLVWALADCVILYTFIRFGYKEFAARVSKRDFGIWTVLVLGTSITLQILFYVEFGSHMGGIYSAFLQNLLMSGLFIAMFYARGGSRGQSLTIAIAKCVGTLAPTIQGGIIEGIGFILVVGILCLLFDLVYIALLVRDRREQNGVESQPSVAV